MKRRLALLVRALLVTAAVTGTASAQAISFGKSLLANVTVAHPTSLQFGPDGKLYVAQQDGTIKVYTIARNGANSYSPTATQTITLITNIPNHDDDGALNTAVTSRLCTGLYVAGTASNPVIYVASSDSRIGGSTEGDLNLDTNSGIISKLTWNGSSWQKIDLVRGLSRSEENHLTNGMHLDKTTNTLYVAQGGNTNMGAPSNNFVFLPEVALSACILAVDLDAIGNTTYDLPTLKNTATPFGGQDGLNQAKLVPNGPVQVYAPGFRNPYDVVITTKDRLYTIDNGSNAGWGGVPVGEGPNGTATNQVNEGGSTQSDRLHFVNGPGYYGVSPNPTRANAANTFAGLSPIAVANPIEGDYRFNSEGNGALTSFPASTNGLTEYTASNFGGAMAGDLLAASFNNTIYRIELDNTGTQATSVTALISNVGAVPLDVTTVGPGFPLAGTIWVGDWSTGKIVVFEPSDFSGGGGSCDPTYSTSIDGDGDGFSNADEIDNGTNPCSAADVPPDADGDHISNLNDSNDDNDALADVNDPFAVDPNNGRTTAIPHVLTFDNDAVVRGGILDLGFTGLMTNGTTPWTQQYDPLKMTAGGAAGVATVDEVPEGDALQTTNTQQYAFQFGINATTSTAPFVAHTRVLAPFAGTTPQNFQSMGLSIGTGNQDNYVKIVCAANGGAGGIQFAKEQTAAFTAHPTASVAMPGPSSVDLYLWVNPSTGLVKGGYAVDGGSITVFTPTFTVPTSWFTASTGLAVGIISTSAGPGGVFPATWDYLQVDPQTDYAGVF